MKILITGASGTIGFNVLKQLITLNEHEITAIDLKSHKSHKRLKLFKKQINIIYGDINNIELINALIRDHEIVIHLAGIIPPFADIKENLCRLVDYEGTKNIIKAINKYNPTCFLLYASSTTVYGSKETPVKVTDSTKVNAEDNYALVKIRSEEQIKEHLKNFVIYRLPAVIGNIKKDAPMYNIPSKSKVEFITANDAAAAFVKGISKKSLLNKKTFNVTGGKDYRIKYRDFLIKVLKTHGISARFIATQILVDKNFYSHYYADSSSLEKKLKFQNGSIDDYLINLKKESNRVLRFFPRLMAIPFILIVKRRNRKK